MGPLDSTIVSVSLPIISEDLGMDYATSIWIPTAYLVVLAALLLTVGRLSDIRGRKPIFIAGFAIFVLGSLLCSISQTGEQIIAFRVVQGVGAAFIMATSTAIITGTFPASERGKALGINTMSVYIGLTVGPPLGAFLTGSLGWPSIFWVNIPIGALVIALAWWKLREPSLGRNREPFDVVGTVTFAVGLVSLLIFLTLGERRGWGDPSISLFLAVSVLAFAAFLVAEKRMGPKAMLNLQLITRNRLFAAANISTLLNYTAYFGVSFILSFYMQRVLGFDLYLTGVVLLSMPLVMSILSPVSGWLSDRIGSRILASSGMFLVALGLLLLSTLGENSTSAAIVAYLVVIGVGMGLFASPNTSAVMGCVERTQLGVASGTLSTMRTVGQSLSLAVMGAMIATAASTELLSSLFMGMPLADGGEAASEFVRGMALAFQVSAGIAVVGALTSLARGPSPAQCIVEQPVK